MSEEFIEDIIAATETIDSSSGNNVVADLASETENVTDDNVNNVDTAVKDVTANSTNSANSAEENKNSVSTTVDSDQPNDIDSTDSGKSANAPGDLSEVEALASKLGWNKDHKGVESVDAATYILRSKDIQKTMREHNKDLKNQLSGLQGSVEALKEHNERVYQADIKKLKNELTVLKKEKKAAVELADVDKVEELDQQIEEVQKDLETPMPKEPVIENPIYDEWIADNGWYLQDKDMAAYADTVADQYVGAPPERIYAIVRQKVAEVFPDKFATNNDNKETGTETVIDNKAKEDKVIGPKSPVEKGSRNGESVGFSKADLSADQLAIMNQFVKGGIMSEDQYIADIAKLQGV